MLLPMLTYAGLSHSVASEIKTWAPHADVCGASMLTYAGLSHSVASEINTPHTVHVSEINTPLLYEGRTGISLHFFLYTFGKENYMDHTSSRYRQGVVG